jgi:hypothetical protein
LKSTHGTCICAANPWTAAANLSVIFANGAVEASGSPNWSWT